MSLPAADLPSCQAEAARLALRQVPVPAPCPGPHLRHSDGLFREDALFPASAEAHPGDLCFACRGTGLIERCAECEAVLGDTAHACAPDRLLCDACAAEAGLHECEPCAGTGAVETPFSGSDPSCGACDGTGRAA